MASSSRFLHLLLFFLLSATLASSTTLSNDIFDARLLPGRSLLQAKAACTVDFENQNYTIITSQCKGPKYQPGPCCKAFLELGCPFSEQLNDMKTDCAVTFFSYINLYGKYPPGLFSNMCHGGKEGLDCSNVGKDDSDSSAAAPPLKSPFIITLFITLFFTFFSIYY